MTQKWPWSRLLSRRRGVAWRGQIAPVDSPESGAPFQIERAMALTLRFTAPLSTDYWDWLDYTIVEDGRRDMHGPHSSHSNMKTSRDWPGIEIGDRIGHPRNLLPSYPDRY